MQQLTQDIKKWALSLGFEKVGIAPAEKLDQESQRLQEWLSRGYQGTMSWMERNVDKRSDPHAILPNAKSVIVVAKNYYADVKHSNDNQTGKISRYAWGDDYHEILLDRLARLLELIRTDKADAHGMVYVDTGPVMEKAWAQKAGIGWQGKHTNIITQDFGSWVFLGEIIVDFELDYDIPATDHCGSCTLCIDACPTQAITEPYVVDSNRCISYLTIEHRGEIAEEQCEQFDRWIYGCDICQDVCPWNKKFSQETSTAEFQPRDWNIAPKLTEVAGMSIQEFQRRFKKSPIKRAKHAGLTRNAEVVLKAQHVHTD